MHNIDQLLALQRSRLNLLEESYNLELEALTKEFETERYEGLREMGIEPQRVCRAFVKELPAYELVASTLEHLALIMT